MPSRSNSQVARPSPPWCGKKSKTRDGLAAEQPLPDAVSGGDRRVLFFPASGNGNGTSWNNRGANGNYWSSSWSSARNARNLNFNSGGVNPQNTNNRYNGFAVRPVQNSFMEAFFLQYNT